MNKTIKQITENARKLVVLGITLDPNKRYLIIGTSKLDDGTIDVWSDANDGGKTAAEVEQWFRETNPNDVNIRLVEVVAEFKPSHEWLRVS